MAKIFPFRGVLYDPGVVKDVAQVVAPPYDIIDAAGQETLYARHPNNVIRLELGREYPTDGPSENRYTRAAACLRDWLQNGVLRRDSKPAVYPYAIEYAAPSPAGDGGGKVLHGFLALAALEEFGGGQIYPHENTRAAAKADRLELLKACRANFSPIWGLFSDPAGSIQTLISRSLEMTRPRIDFRDEEGFHQRLWEITDPTTLQGISNGLNAKSLFIADGHHRYETALAYRRWRREQDAGAGPRPYDAVLMLCSSLEDPGLTILPTHRVLTSPVPPVDQIRSSLKDTCRVVEVSENGSPEGRARFVGSLRVRGEDSHAFGLVLAGAKSYFIITLTPEYEATLTTSARDGLDVSILHNEILSRLHISTSAESSLIYTKDEQEAMDWVQHGRYPAAILLNPTKVSEVQAVATAGERMPHKSTYFYPKPLTGLAMNVFEEGDGQ
jgi:uncharacterized protein (DUF1015 family)